MLFTRLSFSFLFGLSAASVLPDSHLLNIERRQASSSTTTAASTTSSAAAACTNGPNTRGCWDSSTGTNFSIATDAETTWPNTGITVPVGYSDGLSDSLGLPVYQYTLVISAKTLAPDGTSRAMLVVNGTYPGPTLTASELRSSPIMRCPRSNRNHRLGRQTASHCCKSNDRQRVRSSPQFFLIKPSY